MSRESALDALLVEATPTLRVVLRRAYELGYREAIAEAPTRRALPEDRPHDENPTELRDDPAPPDAVQAPAPGVQRLVSDAAPTNPVPVSSPPLLKWDEDSVDDETDNWDGRVSENSRRHRRRVGIRASSTIGALKSKIKRRFRLDRFDIDVVIVRAGDKTRRQLPSHVTLGAYAREE